MLLLPPDVDVVWAVVLTMVTSALGLKAFVEEDGGGVLESSLAV